MGVSRGAGRGILRGGREAVKLGALGRFSPFQPRFSPRRLGEACMSQRRSDATLRVRRSHEPNRLAQDQLTSAYDSVLSIVPSGAPPGNPTTGAALMPAPAISEPPTAAAQPIAA